jgi:uncharacterized protein YcbK (DUF882 family)
MRYSTDEKRKFFDIAIKSGYLDTDTVKNLEFLPVEEFFDNGCMKQEEYYKIIEQIVDKSKIYPPKKIDEAQKDLLIKDKEEVSNSINITKGMKKISINLAKQNKTKNIDKSISISTKDLAKEIEIAREDLSKKDIIIREDQKFIKLW